MSVPFETIHRLRCDSHSRLPLNEMEHAGSNFRNLAINVVNHRETNLALSSLIILISVYTTVISVLRRPFVHPLIACTDFNETFTSEENIDYKYSTMSYVILWLCAIIFGRIISFVKLPSLFGVLLVGIAFKNIPFLSGLLLLDKGISDVLRKAAFSIILIRAAMGFDTGLFRKANKQQIFGHFLCLGSGRMFTVGSVEGTYEQSHCVILRLGTISTLCEIIAIIVAAHFIFCIDVRMGILLGIVLAASASAVIFPVLTNLIAQGYGTGSLFCDVLQSSVTLDNLLCICSLHVAIAIVFAVDISYEIGLMLSQLIVGIIGGVIGGLILWWLPRYDAQHTHFIRCTMLLSTALAFLFGSLAIGCQSGGVFAIAVLTIVAVYRWKLDNRHKIIKEEETFTVMFQLFSMPVMFALIGYDFEIIKLDMQTVLMGLAIIGIGLLIRLISAFLLSFCAGLTVAEQALISVVLLSKATIQAALPSQIVDASLGTAYEHTAVMISGLCVFAIIITAPIGQLLLILLGPSVLHVRDVDQLHINKSTKEHQMPARTYPLSNHYL